MNLFDLAFSNPHRFLYPVKITKASYQKALKARNNGVAQNAGDGDFVSFVQPLEFTNGEKLQFFKIVLKEDRWGRQSACSN